MQELERVLGRAEAVQEELKGSFKGYGEAKSRGIDTQIKEVWKELRGV